jgi:hypothetical protein
MALDAFGRLRVSESFSTFSYYPSPMTPNTDLDIDVWVRLPIGSTQTYNPKNYIEMPIGTGSTYSLRTTKQPMIYQPGKSRLIFMTGVLMETIPTPPLTTTSCMGMFSVDSATPPAATEGTYMKCDGVNLIWEDITQSNASSLVVTSVIQSAWNIDTFNGSGPSGKTLTLANATQTLLIVLDQEWLGVGRIRCGFIIDGVIYYAHQFLHDPLTVQYTKTPRIHSSYLISGTAVNAMRQMCCTSIVECGYYTAGRFNNVNIPINLFAYVGTPTTPSTDTVILGVKIKSSFPNSTFFIKSLAMYYTGGASKYAQYKLQLFSTNGPIGVLSSVPTFTALPDSSVEYYFGGTTVGTSIQVTTPGFIIGSGYLDSLSSINISLTDSDSLQTRQTFTSYDTLYITATANSAGTMGASLTFTEVI